MAARRERSEEGGERRKPAKGLGCIGGSLFFVLGVGVIFVAFALGRAWEAKPPGQDKLTVEDLKRQLEQTSAEARRMAAEALGMKGEDAAPAVQDLTERLKDESEAVRKAAADALGRIGPQAEEALPALQEAMREGSEQVREAAKQAMERIQELRDKE
ncbi:MAG: HEAT repeat domain-containing protein [Planctomycetota bacterium]|nr:HEAT repeat domain-containing protein [Planctomycetota bacterium]